jgi:hypothetical protein
MGKKCSTFLPKFPAFLLKIFSGKTNRGPIHFPPLAFKELLKALERGNKDKICA